MNLKSVLTAIARAIIRRVMIVGVILLYWIISITMVFFNKYLVGNHSDAQDISLFVAWIQCIVCVLFIMLSSHTTHFWDPRNNEALMISWRTTTTKSMLAFSIIFVLMLTFNNLCLKHVGISFFQLARSLTLIFTVILSAVILHKKVSMATVLCCLVVVVGFVLAIDQEHFIGTLSLRGVCYGILTSFFVAACGIMLKLNLDKFNNDSIKVTLHNNFNSVIIFLPMLLMTGELQATVTLDLTYQPKFWLTLIASGVFSFLMSWSSALQVYYTSPVTHHISNNTKSVVQTLIAVLYFKEVKSLLWWCSNVLVICGALAYAIVQIQENASCEDLQKFNRNQVERSEDLNGSIAVKESSLKLNSVLHQV